MVNTPHLSTPVFTLLAVIRTFLHLTILVESSKYSLTLLFDEVTRFSPESSILEHIDSFKWLFPQIEYSRMPDIVSLQTLYRNKT